MHLDAALAWHEAGFCVCPAKADGSKRPRFSWKSFQNKRPRASLVRKWFENEPDLGVGLITGMVSGNLEMLEVEACRMPSEYITKIVEECDALGITWLWDQLNDFGYAESTPSGGIHLLYRVGDGEEVPGNTKIAMDATGKITYAETRGHGGFVIVAPTGGSVHPTGESWDVINGEIGVVPTITRADRDLLHAAVKAALDERVAPVYQPRLPGSFTASRGGGVRPGDAFNNDPNVTIHDILTSNGWKFLGVRNGNQEEYVHPLSSNMRTGSARTNHNGSPNLYAWSGLPSEGHYDKFSLLTHLEYNGDFSAAGRALRAQGYGSTFTIDDMETWVEKPMAADATTDEGARMGDAMEIQTGDTPPVRHRLTEYNHTGAAELARRMIGSNYRHVTEEKGWRFYEDCRWSRDRENNLSHDIKKVTAIIKDITDDEMSRAKEAGDKDQIQAARANAAFGNSTRSNKGTKDVIETFGRERGISVSINRFDADPHLIVLNNGTFDLSTMTLRPHSPSDMVTKRIDVTYDPDAKAPRWLQALEQWVSDPEQREFLQIGVGMTLLAKMEEAAFFILHGPAGCGKSQFLKILMAAFGEYAGVAPQSTFQAPKGGRDKATNDLDGLRGVRFAAISETPEGALLDENLIKSVTGGDAQTSRGLYANFSEWKPQFTVWMATNFLPRLNPEDGAIWRRVKPIEFPNSFTASGEEELGLAERIIASELSGVFNWIIEGARKYLQSGLPKTGKIEEAVREYRTEVDPVKTFLVEADDEGIIQAGEEYEVRSSDLYRVYKHWSERNGLYAISETKFGRRLSVNEIGVRKGNGGIRMRMGVRINPAQFQGEVQGRTDKWW